MNNIKIEYQQIKAGSPASIGLMVEINAPTVAANTVVSRPSRGIVFVVDRSGSMGGGRLEVVKASILDIIGQLDKGDYLSIVTFDSHPQVEVALSKVADLDISETRKIVAGIRTGGNTNLERGYRYGLAEAASAPAGVETTVILLSDGHANAGVSDPAALAQLAAAATEHLITTSTLGIGESYDERILVEMSNTGRGNHFAAVNFSEAALGLNEEMSALLTRTVSNLTVDVLTDGHLAEHVRLSTPHYVHSSSPIASEVNARQFVLGSLGSGEERNFVVELSVSKCSAACQGQSRSGGIKVVASYVDETVKQQESFAEIFKIEEVDAENWVEPARDEDIVMELATARAQDEKERAIRLAREGRLDEAHALLNSMGLDIDEMSASLSDLSPRNRVRAERHRRELTELMSMDRDAFIKRAEESVKRARSSKPDPRQANDNDEQGA